MTSRIFKMYTDGSFNIATSVYGGAYCISNLLEGSFSGKDPKLATSRNVSGECIAVIRGIKALIDKEKLIPGDKVIVYHDYTGLADWAEGRWKAKKAVSLKYVQSIQLFRSKGLIIEFKKVAAHTGIPENEKVDRLAKKAVGLI
ncbi:MAG TPA: RNase H family protein [Lactovum miscens]|uniref:RNase H family protein n=1 Tax=Lactovum miscens TaxID=190387 RepID=UPI002EDB43A7